MIQGLNFSVVPLKAVRNVPFWATNDELIRFWDVLVPDCAGTEAEDGVNNL